VLESRRVFSGRIIEVFSDRIRAPDGAEGIREVVRHPGAAGIVAVLPGTRILLVEQYRYAIGRPLLEIPAGTLEKDESARACAERELREETGYRASRWRELVSFFPAPGTTDEVITVFLAEGLEKGEASPEPDEGIALRTLALREALERVRTKRIRDAKTIVGLLLAADLLGGRRVRRKSS
jgi:ADP-ribose pyrophosphatase